MDTIEKPINPPTAPASKPRSNKQLWIRVLGGLAGAGLVLVLALPTMLGSKWIYEPIIKRLAQDQFKLDIGAVKLSWFNPLEFQEIQISQTVDGLAARGIPPLVTIRSVKSSHGLLGYLMNGRNLGRVEIVEPKLDIALLEDGSNLERLVKSIEGTQAKDPGIGKAKPKLNLD